MDSDSLRNCLACQAIWLANQVQDVFSEKMLEDKELSFSEAVSDAGRGKVGSAVISSTGLSAPSIPWLMQARIWGFDPMDCPNHSNLSVRKWSWWHHFNQSLCTNQFPVPIQCRPGTKSDYPHQLFSIENANHKSNVHHPTNWSRSLTEGAWMKPNTVECGRSLCTATQNM